MGVHFYRWRNGRREEMTHKEFMDYCDSFRTPIYDELLKERGACANCRCTDCGCCYGCGMVDADVLGGAHGMSEYGGGGCV